MAQVEALSGRSLFSSAYSSLFSNSQKNAPVLVLTLGTPHVFAFVS